VFVEYYKLTEQPFGVTPNPRFLFLTPTHREAIASILYGVMENRGFSALIAPPGMGKTTLLFELLQRFGDSVRTVFLFQFQPSPEGLLRNILSELGISDDGLNFEAMQEKLNDLTLQESKKGRRIVVVVDEAQNFREPVLEVLRMLSNFETSQDKLIHIILSGQPQLAEMLFSPAIEQLRQRISIMAALKPLSAAETKDYMRHRLRVAGHRGRPIFSDAACERIAQYSSGIPRNINNLCFNAMSLGCALGRTSIDFGLIDEVFRDLNLADGNETPVNYEAAVNKEASADRTAWRRPAFSTTPSLPALWTPAVPRANHKRLNFAAGFLSFAAVLCIGGVFARQYAASKGATNVSLHTPAPPVPQVQIAPTPVAETAPQSPTETTEAANLKPDSDRSSEPDPEPNPAPTPMKKQRQNAWHRPAASVEEVPVKLVRVAQRQTLYELCRTNLGVCDVNTIGEIRRLNPRLRDSTQVEAGEAVRVPLRIPGKRRLSSSTKTYSEDRP